ncbi:MAG: hypothetical protein JOZ54_04430 [Acidobacteria bacterium]|nr:hypothetical protein [Acidobacteriota bacterium]
MASETLRFLVQRYGADEWLDAESARERTAARRIPPQIEGMRSLRMQEMTVPAEAMDVAGLSRELAAAPRSPIYYTDSTWTPEEEAESPRRLVHLRTFECESGAAARAQLLQLLAEMQGPALERTDVAGDVAFATRGNTLIAGVSGSEAFLLSNGGAELMDLSRIAAELF